MSLSKTHDLWISNNVYKECDVISVIVLWLSLNLLFWHNYKYSVSCKCSTEMSQVPFTQLPPPAPHFDIWRPSVLGKQENYATLLLCSTSISPLQFQCYTSGNCFSQRFVVIDTKICVTISLGPSVFFIYDGTLDSTSLQEKHSPVSRVSDHFMYCYLPFY